MNTKELIQMIKNKRMNSKHFEFIKKILKKRKFSYKNLTIVKRLASKKESTTKQLKEIIDTINIENIKNSPYILLHKIQNGIYRSINYEKDNTLIQPSVIWARSITWSLVGGTFIGLTWLCIAKTEEIVVVPGALEPIRRVIEVQIPEQGVAKEVYIKEGDKIKKGDLLIKLDSEVSEKVFDTQTNILAINQSILKDYEKMYKDGAVSKIQYLNKKIEVEELKSQLNKVSVLLKYQKIIAPGDGTIFDLKIKEPGYVAQTSEPILKIVPNDNLQASIEINSGSIGFVQVGKEVDISIDSFPATDFGVLKGKVLSISSDALPPDPMKAKGYRYPAIIELQNQTLTTARGRNLPLQPGMSLTANIKLRKVSYLKLLLGTFNDKADSLRRL